MAPIVAVDRLRMETDGQGVTTLVAFYGCPLRCRWCLNGFTTAPGTPFTAMTPEALYRRVRQDEVYFLATDGGVTFGGGEPLLYADFIKEFRGLCGSAWRIYAETSLAVPFEQLETALGAVDHFLVDVKDTDPAVYRRYTGQENTRMMENLRVLAKVAPQRVTVRLPLIPHYNTEAHRLRSMTLLKEWGLTDFDLFQYKETV